MKILLFTIAQLLTTTSFFALDKITKATLDSIVKEGDLLYKYEKAVLGMAQT